jgi:hypothetical protein
MSHNLLLSIACIMPRFLCPEIGHRDIRYCEKISQQNFMKM